MSLALIALAQAAPKLDPIAFEAPPAEPWEPTAMFGATRVPVPGEGPEDVEVLSDGRVVVGVEGGQLLVWDGSDWEELANTGGRPLGMDLARDGTLIVADSVAGLLAVDSDGAITVLTTECGGTPLVFTDDVELGPDGMIYFSDASTKWDQAHWEHDIVEARPHGRLCSYDPLSGEVVEMVSNLHFANGVAVDPGGEFLLVNETSRYRVLKVDLADNSTSVFLDDLPGFIDGISSDGDRFWIAVASPRNGLVDRLSDNPRLRGSLLRIPAPLQPKPEATARVIAVNADGEVLHDLFDPGGRDIVVVTSVQVRGDRLYLGSLSDEAFAWAPAPD